MSQNQRIVISLQRPTNFSQIEPSSQQFHELLKQYHRLETKQSKQSVRDVSNLSHNSRVRSEISLYVSKKMGEMQGILIIPTIPLQRNIGQCFHNPNEDGFYLRILYPAKVSTDHECITQKQSAMQALKNCIFHVLSSQHSTKLEPKGNGIWWRVTRKWDGGLSSL